MNERQRLAVVVALLAATGIFGLGAITSAPAGGMAVGIWPVAFGTICCLLVSRRQVIGIAVALVAIEVLTLLVGGRDAMDAVLLGLGLTSQSVVTGWIIGPGTGRPVLHSMSDLARLMRACAGGAGVLGAVGLVTGLVTGGNPVVLALTLGISGLAAQLPTLLLVCRMRDVDISKGLWERSAQWVTTCLCTVVVFVPTNSPPLLFVVFPVLAWVCLRGSSGDARAKMVALEVIAIGLTNHGYGPLARPDLSFPVPVDTQTALLSLFVLITSLQVVLLVVTLGELAHASRVAAAERDRIGRILASITSTAVIGTDRDGLINLFNPGAERLLGYTEDEVRGRSTAMLHPPHAISDKAAELGLEDDLKAVARALIDRGPVEIPFLRADGVERRHLMSLHQVYDANGDVAGRVATSEDVSEILEVQQRLRESLEAERTAVEHLKEVDRVKDAFVSSVSHELRTPLTSILGYLELLQEGSYGDLGQRQEGAVEKIQLNCTRLLALISDLLDIGKLQEGAAEPGQRLDLAQLVRTAVPMIAPAAYARTVRLAMRLPDPLPVRGQRGPLERVVINLVDNAVKFTESDGRVDVRAWIDEPATEVVLEVADSGIGIPLAEQKQLFGRFFRSSLAESRAIPGSGLGLSITRTIVEHHGGTISVHSQPGVGTTFTVRLPLETTYADPPPDLVQLSARPELQRVRSAAIAQP